MSSLQNAASDQTTVNRNLLVSVILPTYNRRELLREAIESLWTQTIDPSLFEIVVVDNASKDGTEEMVREMQRRSPCELRYYRNDRNIGCFANINKSVELCRAPIVASTDDDCRMPPDWLEKGLAEFKDLERIGFVSGRILDKPEQKVTFFSIRNGAPEGENACYPSGNCFYNREIYLKLGGMDMRTVFPDVADLPVGGADTDLAWRMREAGYGYVFSKDVYVWHEVKTVSLKHWLAFHVRIFPLPFLIKRHPAMRKMMLAADPFVMKENIYFYLAVLSLPLAFLHPLALLLFLPWIGFCVHTPGKPFSLARIPALLGRIVFLSIRQAVICGSLVRASIMARTLVL